MIDRQEYVKINGIQQFLYHVGEKEDAPVVLYVHGGPGAAMSVLAYTLKDLYKNFTVVHWDQPGAGRTGISNPDFYPEWEDMIRSMDEIISYLKETYHKEKIAVFAHSWGTVPGVYYANKHPENLLCYIGCGQVVNAMEDEQCGFRECRRRVLAAGDPADVRLLESVGSAYPGGDSGQVRNKMVIVRGLELKYGMMAGSMGQRNSKEAQIKNSPIYREGDWEMEQTAGKYAVKLYSYMMNFNMYRLDSNYRVPFYLISGREDWVTPFSQGARYFEDITAPDKKLWALDGCGHKPMYDRPQQFLHAFADCISRAESVSDSVI